MSDQVMITVAADSLSAAIAGVLRGERWADGDGYILVVERDTGYVVSVPSGPTGVAGYPAASGWRRADAPVLCPRCGKEMRLEHVADRWGWVCPGCYLKDWLGGVGYSSEREARAAIARIGPQWRRPEEKPERYGEAVAWWGRDHNPTTEAVFPGYVWPMGVVAWRYLDPPPWETKR